MEVFKYSSWIWPQNASGNDTHVEFLSNLEWNGGKAICNLSCDSDYQLYVNGKFVQSNQYLSFDHYKAYDEIDVTPYLNKGNNVIAIHVWYFGVPSQRYQTASAGLIFEVTVDGTVALSCSSKVLGRKSLVYESGMCKMITVQLGLTFKYDATKEETAIIAQKLVNGDLIPAALSMKVFRYDTLLLADEAKYSQYILDDMRRDFKVMLDNGATATWETIDGAVAFDDAGSLCHGWTALPVYYFNRLGVIVK